MTVKPFVFAAVGLISISAPLQVSAQDTAGTTTTVQREDDGFDMGWLGLLGLKRKDNHITPTNTTSPRV